MRLAAPDASVDVERIVARRAVGGGAGNLDGRGVGKRVGGGADEAVERQPPVERYALAIADGSVNVDGRDIYQAKGMKVGVFTSTSDF